MKKSAFDVLSERGFVKQTVFEEDLKKLLENESVSFYVGFDPTADSLHIGHYIPIMAMLHLQRAGHKPIALFGGGTALIGDPSGKSDMRAMLTKDEVESNVSGITKQLESFFVRHGGHGGAPCQTVNNIEWLGQLNYIDFLREIGVYFSVNKMLAADCYRSRMEKGLNFLEFNYMLMQSYDFYVLNKKHNCVLQMGGNDQWSNMLFGADLIRRKERTDAYALTFPLLVTSSGVKMGKTQKGALWLDKNRTTPYEFYQYFRNVEDEKVDECLRLLTFLPLDEIAELTKHRDERMNKAKERLAYEVASLIHGEEAAKQAKEESEGAFGSGSAMPTLKIEADLSLSVIDLMVKAGVGATKSDCRRLIEGGGVKLNGQKVESVNSLISDFTDKNEVILQKGKKTHIKIEF